MNLRRAVSDFLHGSIQHEDREFGARTDDAFIAWAIRVKRWQGRPEALKDLREQIKAEIDRQLE